MQICKLHIGLQRDGKFLVNYWKLTRIFWESFQKFTRHFPPLCNPNNYLANQTTYQNINTKSSFLDSLVS